MKKVWTLNRNGLSAVTASFSAAILAAIGKYDIVHFHAEGPAAALWIPKMFGEALCCNCAWARLEEGKMVWYFRLKSTLNLGKKF